MPSESGRSDCDEELLSPVRIPFVSPIRAFGRLIVNWCLFGEGVDPFRRAAVIYFFYGAIYFGGAIVQLTSERRTVFFGFVPWWAFYLLGALVVIGFPLLVWNRFKWFTRILAVGPFIKASTLAARQLPAEVESGSINPFPWIFAATAIWAAVHLFYAGWRDLLAIRRPENSGG